MILEPAYGADVEFEFTSYSGPSAQRFVGAPLGYGTVNGVRLSVDESLGVHVPYAGVEVLRTPPISLPPGSGRIDFTASSRDENTNFLQFESAPLDDAAAGDTVLLGVLRFKAGSWFEDPLGASIGWRVRIHSTNDDPNEFVQTGTFLIQQGTRSDASTLNDNRADWLHIPERPKLGSLRVFDASSRPIGQGSVGAVEIWATIGSDGEGLEFESLRAAEGGFLTASVVADSEGQIPAPDVALFSSLLPTSRTVLMGSTATVFATIINAGSATATQCRIELDDPSLPIAFSFQATDPETNQAVGSVDTPVDIVSGGSQSFLLSLTPNAALEAFDTEFVFRCGTAAIAPTFIGLNTLLFSAVEEMSPDIVALAATPSSDGIVALDIKNLIGAFAVASVNVGGAGTLTVTVDDGRADLPVQYTLCQTDPVLGNCINPTNPSAGPVSVDIGAGETPTFGVFAVARSSIQLDPAGKRVFVRFSDTTGAVRGSTSVAIRTDLAEIAAGADVSGAAGELVTLNSSPQIEGLELFSQAWRQVAGPIVASESSEPGQLSFNIPASNCSEQLVFELEAIYTNGVTAQDRVTVTSVPDTTGFTASAGSSKTMLSGPTRTDFSSRSQTNSISLTGHTDLEPCNIAEIGWEQTGGSPIVSTSFGRGMGIELQTRPSLSDENLEFEFSVRAVDGRTEADRVNVRLIDARQLPLLRQADRAFRVADATDSEVLITDRDGLALIDRVSGQRKQLSNTFGYVEDGTLFEMPVSISMPQFSGSNDSVVAWVEDKLFGYDISAMPTAEYFRVRRLCGNCSDSLALNGTSVFYLIENDDNQTEVYRRPIVEDNSESTLVTTLPEQELRFSVFESQIYTYQSSEAMRRMWVHDLSTGLDTELISDVGGSRPGFLRPIIAGSKVFWEASGALYEIDTTTLQTRLVADDYGSVRSLAVVGDWVYLVGDDDSENAGKLVGIRISDGFVAELLFENNLFAVAELAGNLYLLAHDQFQTGISRIFRLNAASELELLQEIDRPDFVASEMYALGSHLVFHRFDRLSFFSLSTQELTILSDNRFERIVARGGDLWFLDGDTQIGRIPDGVPPARPIPLDTRPAATQTPEQLIVGERLFAIHSFRDSVTTQQMYEIRSTDALGNTPLSHFVSAGELKSLGVHGNRLYFQCADSCGVEGASLASISLSVIEEPRFHLELSDPSPPPFVSQPGIIHGEERIFVNYGLSSNNAQLYDLNSGLVQPLDFSISGELVDRGAYVYLVYSNLMVRRRMPEPSDLIYQQKVYNDAGGVITPSSLTPLDNEIILYDGQLKVLRD